MAERPIHDDPTLDAPPRALGEAPPARDAYEVGAIVADRFRLERKLGEGGMGVVWEATHVVTRRSRALKFLKPSGSDPLAAQARFLREARATSAVNHPGLLPVHDVLQLDDGTLCMVMDLLRGESFGTKLSREGALPLTEVASILVKVCAAVSAAHAAGIVHRDLKPDNIFLALEGDGSMSVKVLDFGIAKLMGPEEEAARSGPSTDANVILGTPFYMAPEQLFGDKALDHRADLWALGVILYEALAGVRPTEADSVGAVVKIVAQGKIVALAERVSGLPEPVTALVGRLLTYDRQARPADAREVGTVLAAYVARTSERAAAELAFAPTAEGPVARPPERRKSRAWLFGGIAVLAAAAASFTWAHTRPVKGVPLTSHPSPPSKSPEAIVHYRSALSRLRIGELESFSEFRRSIELDPTLAAAQLRVALYGAWCGLPAEGRRNAFLAASALSGSLEPRDEALLPVARAASAEPPDFDGALALLKPIEAQASEDAELPLLRYVYALVLERPDLRAAAERRVLELDPGSTQVLNQDARILLVTHDLAGARTVAERCLAASPEASMCLQTLSRIHSQEGSCKAVLADAHRLVELEPALSRSYEVLAQALAATGGSAVDPLRQAAARDRPNPRRPTGVQELQISLFAGDLDSADRQLGAMGAEFASSSTEEDHIWVTAERVRVMVEIGDLERALALGDDFVRRVPSWTANAPWGVRLQRAFVQHQAGILDDVTFASRLDDLTSVLPPDGEHERDWLNWDYAGTSSEARLVLQRRPDIFTRSIDATTFGHLLLLTGDVGRAAVVLRGAASDCRVISPDLPDSAPLRSLHAHLYLGQALEAKGDTTGACAAYAVVEQRWKNAKPRSVTLEKAQERMKALGCGP